MNLITIILICLVIELIALSIVSWRILNILDKEWNERIDKLRVEVEAAKQQREEVRWELAEFHRKRDNQHG